MKGKSGVPPYLFSLVFIIVLCECKRAHTLYEVMPKSTKPILLELLL